MTTRAAAFVIEELTGQRRSIELRGRALPYRGGAWPSEQRSNITWYAGNPEATQQLLGPEDGPLQIEGRWSDRYIGGLVVVSGFDAIRLAEDLVRIFEDLSRSGQQLRVEWGPQLRTGILKSFTPSYERQEDVRWSATFEWSGHGITAPRALTAEREPATQLREAQNGVDDQLAFEPRGLLETFTADVVAATFELRELSTRAFDAARELQGAIVVPLQAVRNLVTVADEIRLEAEELLKSLSDNPLEAVLTSDRVADHLRTERWRRTLGRRTQAFRATAMREALRQLERARPDPIRIVTVRQRSTLQMIALREYGSADDWQLLASVNSLTSSLVEEGTLLLIPPRTGLSGESC